MSCLRDGLDEEMALWATFSTGPWENRARIQARLERRGIRSSDTLKRANHFRGSDRTSPRPGMLIARIILCEPKRGMMRTRAKSPHKQRSGELHVTDSLRDGMGLALAPVSMINPAPASFFQCPIIPLQDGARDSGQPCPVHVYSSWRTGASKEPHVGCTVCLSAWLVYVN